jgi:hypothetical protein
MDCNHARLLLAFSPKKAELDTAEAEALQAHFDQCAECETLAQAEHALDEGLGRAMNAVPVPAGWQFRLGARLKKQRRVHLRLRRAVAAMASAAAILLIVWGWYAQRPPRVDMDKVRQWVQDFVEPTDVILTAQAPAKVEEAFAAWGMPVEAPRIFNYSLLKSFDRATCLGRQVPRLLFATRERDQVAIAEVYVLSADTFNLTDLKSELDRQKNLGAPGSRFNWHVVESSGESMLLIILQGESLEPFYDRSHFQ